MGLPAAQHAFSGTARSDAGFDRHPLAWWPLAGKASEQAEALAVGLRTTLEKGANWLVEGEAGEHRPLAAGDIAVLCRSNTDVTRFAAALSHAGLPVAVERSGLTRTPHVELVLAACRWIADPSDRLALAELARFFADDSESDAWLVAAADEEPVAALRALVPVTEALERLRGQLLNFTPAELVDAVLTQPEVIGRIEAWGDHPSRVDDLEALRGFAGTYEAECAASGAPATLQGLLLALQDADPKRPPSLAADAIQVMTYHGAKGLEWPMTVLTSLSWEPRARLYEPVSASQAKAARPFLPAQPARSLRTTPQKPNSNGCSDSPVAEAAVTGIADAPTLRALTVTELPTAPRPETPAARPQAQPTPPYQYPTAPNSQTPPSTTQRVSATPPPARDTGSNSSGWIVLLALVVAGVVLWRRRSKAPQQPVSQPPSHADAPSGGFRIVVTSDPVSPRRSPPSFSGPSPGTLKEQSERCWVRSDRSLTIAGYELRGGLLYVGKELDRQDGGGVDNCLINPTLSVSDPRGLASLNGAISLSDISSLSHRYNTKG